MSPQVAKVVAYGGSWTVVMTLAHTLGWWSIPVSLTLLLIVCLLSALVQARERVAVLLVLLQRQRQGQPQTLDPEP